MRQNKKISVIIPAAGTGSRFGVKKPKQYSMLGAQTVLEKTVNIFLDILEVNLICIAVNPDDQFIHEQSFVNHPKILIVHGGGSRSHSVFNAAMNIDPDELGGILIHDAVRPWLQADHLSFLLAEFQQSDEWDGVYPGITSIDSLREKRDSKFISVDRENFMQIQTPQIFDAPSLKKALSKAMDSGINFSDEAQVMEFSNFRVKPVKGERSNIKITFSDDLRPSFASDDRIGRGIDFHKLESGTGITLGSVFIECDLGIIAHSDGDIVLHALADSLLGAGGLNDIGYYFPDTDPENKNLSSLIILEKTLSLLGNKNLKPNNIDLVIVCEKPKIAPHVSDIKLALANLLEIVEDAISIKATTTEGLGVIGKGNGIAVYAIASLKKELA